MVRAECIKDTDDRQRYDITAGEEYFIVSIFNAEWAGDKEYVELVGDDYGVPCCEYPKSWFIVYGTAEEIEFLRKLPRYYEKESEELRNISIN